MRQSPHSLKKKTIATTNPIRTPRSRSPRPRLRNPLPPPRPHPHRIPQRRHALLLHPQPPPRRRILRLLGRDPQTHVRRRAAAACLLGLRGAGRRSVLGAADGGGVGGFWRERFVFESLSLRFSWFHHSWILISTLIKMGLLTLKRIAGDRERVSKRYVDQVRLRKGMVVQRKVVGDAEKQKTLKR